MSRVEKILIALINGTSYDGPLLSRVEEILYSFLVDSTYDKSAESRVEDLLLALKNSSLYSDSVISRIEEILYCKLGNVEYTGPIGSSVEALLVQWELTKIIVVTGIPPLTFNAKGTPLLDYTIYGNTVQEGTPTPDSPIEPEFVGERTENLFDKSKALLGYEIYGGTLRPNSNWGVSDYIPIENNKIYAKTGAGNATLLYNEIDGTPTPRTFITNFTNTSGAKYFRINFTLSNIDQVAVKQGSTALPYEPYGYKIPISSGGVNLFDPENTEFGIILNDGSIGGAATGFGIVSDFIDVSTNSAVTLSQNNLKEQASSVYAAIGCWDSNKNFIAGSRVYVYVRSIDSPERKIITKEFPEGTKYIRVNICVDSRSDSPTTVQPMLNWGNEALPYEPYVTPTVKNIYLGQTPTTRKIKKLVLTGEEGIHRSAYYGGSFAYDNPNISTAITRVFSTHFEGSDSVPAIAQRPGKAFVATAPGVVFNTIMFGDWQFSGEATAFNAWLAAQYAAGTPVVVWYVLATPETGIVNEPLAKIGDYADSVDFSQAGVEIPVTAGENTLSVGTTVQPSNMSIEVEEGHIPKKPVYITSDDKLYITSNDEVYILRR